MGCLPARVNNPRYKDIALDGIIRNISTNGRTLERVKTLTIEYPEELLWALQQEPNEFAADARVLLAVKLYETGKLSTGLAAKIAGVPRGVFPILGNC